MVSVDVILKLRKELGVKRSCSIGGVMTSDARYGRTVAQPLSDARKDTARTGIRHVLYWRFFINLALMLIDASMYIFAGATVLNLRGEAGPLHSERFGFTLSPAVYLLVVACFWIWSLRTVGVYRRHVMGDGYQLNALLVKGMVVCWVIQCAMNFFFDFSLTLTSLCLIVLSGWLVTMLERVVSRWFITSSRKKGQYAYSTVLVGSPEGIARMLRFFAKRQQLNYRPVAVCPIRLDPRTETIEALPLAGDGMDGTGETDLRQLMVDNWGEPLPVVAYSGNHLAEDIVALDAQTVMVCDTISRYSDVYNTFSVRMESLGLEVAMLASAADTSNHEISVRSIQGTTIITQRMPQYTPAARFAKRMFDVVVSLVAIVLSSPIMLVTALLIKKEDGGPVLYSQTRIGLQGKPFKIHKFRSMRVDADKHLAEVAAANGQALGARVKIKKDPRITNIGHIIRKTSIDELPQFFDVLMGAMSVVGPRPQRQFEVDEYSDLFATRLLVKPGITGPWQVSGRNDLSDEESEALDVAYVQDWSVLGDVIYILRTVGTVLHPNGAY